MDKRVGAWFEDVLETYVSVVLRLRSLKCRVGFGNLCCNSFLGVGGYFSLRTVVLWDSYSDGYLFLDGVSV